MSALRPVPASEGPKLGRTPHPVGLQIGRGRHQIGCGRHLRASSRGGDIYVPVIWGPRARAVGPTFFPAAAFLWELHPFVSSPLLSLSEGSLGRRPSMPSSTRHFTALVCRGPELAALRQIFLCADAPAWMDVEYLPRPRELSVPNL